MAGHRVWARKKCHLSHDSSEWSLARFLKKLTRVRGRKKYPLESWKSSSSGEKLDSLDLWLEFLKSSANSSWKVNSFWWPLTFVSTFEGKMCLLLVCRNHSIIILPSKNLCNQLKSILKTTDNSFLRTSYYPRSNIDESHFRAL